MHEERPARDEARPTDERESAYDLLQRGQALLQRHHNAQAAVVLEDVSGTDFVAVDLGHLGDRARLNWRVL